MCHECDNRHTRHKGHCVAVRTSRVKHAAWNVWPHRAARAYRPGV
jgi:hypothetical protein